MKKLFVLSIIGLCGIIACTKKAAPSSSGMSSSGTSTSSTTGSKTDGTVTTSGTKPDYPQKPDEVGKTETEAKPASTMPAAPNKPSEEETGRSVYSTKCTKCHAAKTVNAYTFNQWEGILKQMVPKAKLSNDEELQVIAYIKANAK